MSELVIVPKWEDDQHTVKKDEILPQPELHYRVTVIKELAFSSVSFAKLKAMAVNLKQPLDRFVLLALQTYYSLVKEQQSGKTVYLGCNGWVLECLNLDRFPENDPCEDPNQGNASNEKSVRVALSMTKLENAVHELQLNMSVPEFLNNAIWTYYHLAVELQAGKEVYLGRDDWAEERMVLEELMVRK